MNNKTVEKELTGVIGLVDKVLSEYPETRSNDSALFIQVCKKLGLTSLEDMKNVPLLTITRARQHIQNELGRWQPDEEIKKLRKDRQIQFKQYMAQLKEAK
ncbi:hypothetical protein [Tuberibacillus calidus]|uniref:hypothetical protein n=1 Tax=Tuberibacillus calidus TaxID=340097 RepID=UPI0004841F30|nr:hypothetical protein [Tuberibacillus calidus]